MKNENVFFPSVSAAKKGNRAGLSCCNGAEMSNMKLILIGNTQVGKTSLLQRYTEKKFDFDVISTVGVDFSTMERTLDGENVKIQLWDTAGQEKFRTITYNYYRSSNGVAIVYDVTSQESFEKVDTWFTEIRKNAPEEISVVLIANKTDLEGQRVVSKEVGQKMAEEKGCKFFEVSAKTGLGVDSAFDALIEVSHKKMKESKKVPEKNKIVFGETEKAPKKKCC